MVAHAYNHSTLRRLRQEDHEFEATLGCMINSDVTVNPFLNKTRAKYCVLLSSSTCLYDAMGKWPFPCL